MHLDKEREILQDDWVKVIRALRAIRDDLDVRSRLASAELRDEWSKLEPRFEEAERYVHVISDATLGAMRDLLRGAKRLNEKLRDGGAVRSRGTTH